MPEVFGWQHLTFLAVFTVISVVAILLAKKFLKTKKQQTIFIKAIAFLLLFNLVLLRAEMARIFGIKYLIPTSICSLTSLIFAVLVLFGKPNMRAYHCFWYMAVGGGIITLIYPDFISQNQSIFYLSTITSFLHHGLCVVLAISMLVFGWFKPELKKVYYFPMMFCVYIVLGAFEWHVLNTSEAMNLTKPLLSGTPFNIWFIWAVSTGIVVVVALIVELIRKALNSRKQKLQPEEIQS